MGVRREEQGRARGEAAALSMFVGLAAKGDTWQGMLDSIATHHRSARATNSPKQRPQAAANSSSSWHHTAGAVPAGRRG